MKNYPLYDCGNIKDLRDLVNQTAQLWGEKDLFRIPNRDGSYECVSYHTFASDIEALGAYLCSAGLGGKRIAIMGGNSYGWALAYLAITCSGGCAVPIDGELSEGDVCNITLQTHAEALFYSAPCAEVLGAVRRACPEMKHTICLDTVGANEGDRNIYSLLEAGRGLSAAERALYSEIELTGDTLCVILFTSGTTGVSKGVMLTHGNIAANITAAVRMVHMTGDDVFLSVLPYHHTYECTCGLMVVMRWGSCICFNNSIKDVSKNLKRFQPTAMLLVPLYVESFYKKIMESVAESGSEKKLKFAIRLSSFLMFFGIDIREKLFSKILDAFGGKLKTIVCGGAYLRPYYVKKFWQFGITILQGYGITECSPLVAVNRNKCWKFDAVGMVIPCNEVKIDAGEDGYGEILIKGTNVMQGYLDKPELTAAAFDDGWYRSGDIGYLGKNNFLHIIGRKSNLIVLKSGKNVAPEEIEAELTRNEMIKEVVLVGRKDKDGVSGLFAYIRLEDKFINESDYIVNHDKVKAIIEAFNTQNPFYKQIADFALVNSDFPKTTSRKIMRYKVGEDDDGVR